MSRHGSDWFERGPTAADLEHDPLLRAARDPANRLGDAPGELSLLESFVMSGDPYLRDLLAHLVNDKQAERILADDPFHGNYPLAADALTAEPALCAGVMPRGRVLPLPVSRVPSGTCFVGPTGMAKTTLAQLWVHQLIREAAACAVVLDAKGTWNSIAGWPGMAERTVVLSVSELAISLLQPPPGVPMPTWLNSIENVFKTAFRIMSAQRLLRAKCQEVLARCPSGVYPPLWVLREQVRGHRPGRGSREVNYKESILGALTALGNTLGVFDYAASNMLERLFAEPRLIVIRTENTPPDELCFIGALLIEWLFVYRQHNPSQRGLLAQFVLEDATPIVGPQRSRETPGGLSVVDQKANLTREMNMGLLIIAHEFAQLSDALVSACENLVAFSPRRDAGFLLQRLFGMDAEQTRAMKEFSRGMATASIPSVWPKPVPICFPPPPIGGAS